MKRIFPSLPIGAVCLFVFFALPAGAETSPNRFSLSFQGMILALPEDNGLASDPMPVLPSLGVSAAYLLAGPWWLELSLDIYSTQYGYSDALERAVPLAIENRWTTAIGFVTGLEILLRFDLNELMVVRVYGGPGADLRLCYIAADLNDNEQEEASRQTEAVADYFWDQGRWFLPVFGTGLDFNVNSAFRLGLDLRIWFPVYKLWTGEDLPFVEGWRLGAGFKLTLR
jgi:hypothetical protein